jgi:hypothetical protein
MKNYTSGVPVEKTISRIEQALASVPGVNGIMKEYSGGKLSSLCFRVKLPKGGKTVAIKLPANHKAVYEVLRKNIIRPREGTLDKLEDQALRTSWKLMQDWVLVQLSLIEMQSADLMQVFLPYAWDGKQTYYEQLMAKQFKALPDARPDESIVDVEVQHE